jgi:sec-independent protein translocase protein TatC
MIVEEEKEMSFLDHLEELRWHLIRALVVVLLITIVAFVRKDIVFDTIILGPSKVDFWTYRMLCKLGQWLGAEGLCVTKIDFILQNRTMAGQFSTHISTSFIAGLVLGFPYVFWEIWRFVKPGLYHTEKKLTRGAVAFVTFLFATGISFGYYILTPLTINFLANYKISEVIDNQIDLSSYISTVTMLVLACGIMFELPAIVMVAARAGLVSGKVMRQYRKHAVIVILIVAAILTPSPDMMSQIIMSIPLYALYEFSILLAAMADRARAKEALAQQFSE